MFTHNPEKGDAETFAREELTKAGLSFETLEIEEILTQPNGVKIYRLILT